MDPIEQLEILLPQLSACTPNSKQEKVSSLLEGQYLEVVNKIEAVMCRSPTEFMSRAYERGLISLILGEAITHGLKGYLSWVTLNSWCSIIRVIFSSIRKDLSKYCLIPKMLETVANLSKDRAGISHPHYSSVLCSSLEFLRVILQFHDTPVSIVPRQLPHPLYTTPVAPRLSAFRALPWLLKRCLATEPTNNAQGKESEGATSGWILSVQWVEYITKGVSGRDFAVREASVECIRNIFDQGMGATGTTTDMLMDTFLEAVESDHLTSLRIQEDMGISLGYLLACFQTGSQCMTGEQLRFYGPFLSSWTYCFGVSKLASEKLVKRIFTPLLSHAAQNSIAIALSQLLLLCTLPSSAYEPLRQLVTLPDHFTGEELHYLPRVISRSVELWFEKISPEPQRLEIAKTLRTLLLESVQSKSRVTIITTALRAIIPLLSTSRDLGVSLSRDLLDLASKNSNLVGVAHESIGAIAEKNPLVMRILLNKLHSVYTSVIAGEPLTLRLSLVVRSLLALSKDVLSQPRFLQPLLFTAASLGMEKIEPDIGESLYPKNFLLLQVLIVLFDCHSHHLSNSSIKMIRGIACGYLSALSRVPLSSSKYYRIVGLVCKLLTHTGAAEMEQELCLGLLERQAMEGTRSPASANEPGQGLHLQVARVKRDVYGVFLSKNTFPCLGTDCFPTLVSYAVRDLLFLCEQNIPIDFPDEEFFPGSASALISASRSIFPNYSSQLWAEVGWQSIRIIARVLQAVSPSHASDVVNIANMLQKTLESSMQKGEKATNAVWNILCCICTGLRSLVRSEGAVANVCYNKAFQGALEKLDVSIAFLAESEVVDIKIIASRARSFALIALSKVGTYTTSVTQLKYNSSSALSGGVLTLGEMHAEVRSTTGEDSCLSTFPIAVSFVSDALKQNSIFGDPCSLETMCIVLSLVRMSEVYPRQVCEAISRFVGSLYKPINLPIDPLISSLFLLVLKFLYPESATNSPIYSLASLSFSRAISFCVLQHAGLSNQLLSIVSDSLMKKLIPFDNEILLYWLVEVANYHMQHEIALEENNSMNIANMIHILTGQGGEKQSRRISLLCIGFHISWAQEPETRDAWERVGLQIVLRCQTSDEVLLILRTISSLIHSKQKSTENLKRAIFQDGKLPVLASSTKGGEWESGDDSIFSGRISRASAGGGGGGFKNEGCITSGSFAFNTAAKICMNRLLSELMAVPALSKHTENHLSENGVPSPESDHIEQELIGIVLSTVPFVETDAQLTPSTILALRSLFELLGKRTSPAYGTPYLLEWKARILSSVKTLVQASLFCLPFTTILVRSFLLSNLADDSSARKVIQTLFNLLETLEALSEEEGTISHYESAELVLLFAEIGRLSEANNWHQTQDAILDALQSTSGQFAIGLICDQVSSQVSVTNGFTDPSIAVHLQGDFLNEGVISSLFYLLSLISANGGTLSLSTRHSAGMVIALSSSGAIRSFGRPPLIIALLSITHQQVISEIMWQTALSICHSENREAELAICLENLARATIPKEPSEVATLTRSIIKDQTILSPSIVAPLLSLLMQACCETSLIAELVSFARADDILSDEPLWRLCIDTYCLSDLEIQKTVALSGPPGFVLGRLAELYRDSKLTNTEEGKRTNWSLTVHSAKLLENCLLQTEDPLLFVKRMYPNLVFSVESCCLISSVLCTTAAPPSLHQKWISLIAFVLNCFIDIGALKDNTQKRLDIFLRILLEILKFDATYATEPPILHVGVLLTTQVARTYGTQLREAIRDLGVEASSILRSFMEKSSAWSIQSQIDSERKKADLAKGDNSSSNEGKRQNHKLSINIVSFT